MQYLDKIVLLLSCMVEVYIIFEFFKNFNKRKEIFKKKRKVNNKIITMYICVPIANLAIMLLAYYFGIEFNGEYPMRVFVSMCFALMIIGNILVFYIFNRYSEEVNTNIEHELKIACQNAELSYYAHIQETNEKYMEFIHNTSHYLKAIGELAKKNQSDSILDILCELHVELEDSALSLWSENPIINAILNEKEAQCSKMGVSFDAYVEPGTHMGNVSDMDKITMLGNLLDNAICASIQGQEDSFVKICIFMQNKGSFCVVKITNNFEGEIKRNENGFISTKKEKGIHGIGIKSVNNTAENYNGYLECFIEENIFTAILILPAI